MPPQLPGGILSNPRYPTFYACYLLQSLQHPGSTKIYIGSTPKPIRRLRQHNGEITAGAWKTLNGRPWDMAMIVHGFPSKTAALQFEWAWQHPDRSVNLKGTDGKALVAQSRTLRGNIQTVRLMVNKHPYSTWPLHVKLFSVEAATAWNNAAKAYPVLPLGFTSSVELEGVDGKKASIHVGSGRTGPIDVHDTAFTTQHLAAAVTIRELRTEVKCSICKDDIDFKKVDPLAVALCPTASCYAVSHLNCLAASFLSEEHSNGVIPRGGSCSNCHEWVLWGDIIRGADRRRFGVPVADEDDDMMDVGNEDKIGNGAEPMEWYATENSASGSSKSKVASRARQASPKKLTITTTGLTPVSKGPTKKKLPNVATEKPRRGLSPKKSRTKRAGAAAYATSAFSATQDDEEVEDFSALMASIPDVSDDDSSDNVAAALAVVTPKSPTRTRYV